MRKLLVFLLLTGLATGCICIKGPVIAEKSCARHGKLRHVVLMKFTDQTSPEQIRAIERRFCELTDKIDAVRGFEWGTDVSTEGRAEGFTHCFIVTFADIAGRDQYLPHPAHKEFVEFLKPYLDKVLVIDFWARS